MLTAFCEAFRNTPDATLVLKLGHHEYQDAINGILMCIARLPAFQCRVVIIHGYLEKAEFEALIGISSFVVNTSHGEGQCLPLMEFMSCGKPAVAPLHSAMLDYIDGQVAFLMASWLDATAWPQDPRLAYRTCRHQIDWSSLVAAYRAAYDCAKLEPSRYRLMSETAAARMQQHCSKETAKQRLELFLKTTYLALMNHFEIFSRLAGIENTPESVTAAWQDMKSAPDFIDSRNCGLLDAVQSAGTSQRRMSFSKGFRSAQTIVFSMSVAAQAGPRCFAPTAALPSPLPTSSKRKLHPCARESHRQRPAAARD